jgi:hypothetical protein
MLKTLFLALALTCLANSTPINNDPCIYVHCPSGNICIRSIDGYSYNCVAESSFSNQVTYGSSNSPLKMGSSMSNNVVQNFPVNYFEKYLTMSPCMSSPCGERQVCRNLPDSQYVCKSELDRSANMMQVPENNRQGVWENLQRIWNTGRARNGYKRITPLKAAKKSKLRDEDYDEKTSEELEDSLGDICENAEPGTKIVNPNIINQYVICLPNNKYVLRNCQRGRVFNTFSKDCELTRDIPGEHFKDTNPCMNNSTFVPTDNFQYRCDCPPGFTGKNCDKKDICQPSFCGDTGVCLSIGYDNEYSHLCWCNNGVDIGKNCKSPKSLEPNPCMNINSDLEYHVLNLSPSVYVKCVEENKPMLSICQYPLVFSESIQECDWSI